MSPTFRRNGKPPRPAPSIRTQVDKNLHTAVDAALRDLKKFSRRLHSTFDAFSEELQVLDRVFYKGKNQHRSALFFRRVADIRKFSQRISQYNAPQIIDAFRCSFFGPDAQTNSKALKGAWSHVPDDKTMAYTLNRLAGGVALCDEAHARLLNAYRTFVLEMQSGFFLQLILTLAAVSSRLDILVQDLNDALRSSWASTRQLFCSLNPSEARKVLHLETAGGSSTTGSNLPPPAILQALPVAEEAMVDGEDTGETITRIEAPVQSSWKRTSASMAPSPAEPADGPPGEAGSCCPTPDVPILHPTDDEDTIVVGNIVEAPILAPSIDVIPATSSSRAAAVEPKSRPAAAREPPPASTAPTKKRVAEKDKGKEPVPKKKKRKKDAIDDIFGF
ncbi:hypothetical protein HDZ31DRAFT_82595 [Schizophyllum fasciatum]